MKKFFIALTLLALLTLGLSWPNFLYFFYCKPDLLLIFTVALVLMTDFRTALFFGILAGAAKDIFLPGNLAVNMICFSLWCYVLHRLSRQISTKESYVRLTIILVVALFNNLFIGLFSLASGSVISPGIFLRNLILVSVYTTGLSPWIFKLTQRITASLL